MKLSTLEIKNFRGIRELCINFEKDVTVLVGENNGGKTSIIDALRLVLMQPGSIDACRATVEDFHDNNRESDIEIVAEFDELTPDEQINMDEALYAEASEGGATLKGRLTYTAHYNAEKDKVRTNIAGGLSDGSRVGGNIFEFIDVTYLKPLRDPATGLHAGKYSCVSKHAMQSITQERKLEITEKLVDGQKDVENEFIDMQNEYNKNMLEMLGETMSQNINLKFMPRSFENLIASLKTIVDGKEYDINGLGYNNLVYMAMVIAQHENHSNAFNIIVIEEPEAHLHPILLRNFFEYVKKMCMRANCQVIITTHSPVLASKANLNSIRHIQINGEDRVANMIAIDESNNVTSSCNSLNKKMKRKLQRYLDATRSELFFTENVLLVEGVAEQLILPYIGEKIGYDFDKQNITVINCQGLNFDIFIPVLKSLKINAAIITDTDRTKDEGESSYLKKISDELVGDAKIRIFKTELTFEHALVQHDIVFSCAMRAMSKFHPIRVDNLGKEDTQYQKDHFYEIFFKKMETSKGEFAQELIEMMDEQKYDWGLNDFPANIVGAICWLSNINK